MDGKTISRVFLRDKCVKKWFKGFLTPDLSIPNRRFKTPALFVLNTDNYDGPGEHWCILLILNGRRAEFFDSFGQSPTVYNFTEEILRHVKRIQFNEYPVQATTAATCGHHCIFWAFHRSRGMRPKDIMKLYSMHSCEKNDLLAYNFVKRNFGAATAKIII